MVEPAGFENLLGKSVFFTVDPFGRLAGHPGIFAGGDARAGGNSVSGAIGDGRRAAAAICSYIEGIDQPHDEPRRPIGFNELNANYFDHAARAGVSIVLPENRSAQVEIEGPLSRDGLDTEARRCFSCGECMACDNCWTLCPDNSVLKAQSAGEDRVALRIRLRPLQGMRHLRTRVPCRIYRDGR